MTRKSGVTLFKPTRAESKQAATDETARAILEAEAERRQIKTERLRKLRLAAESGDEEDAKTIKRSRKKSASAGR